MEGQKDSLPPSTPGWGSTPNEVIVLASPRFWSGSRGRSLVIASIFFTTKAQRAQRFLTTEYSELGECTEWGDRAGFAALLDWVARTQLGNRVNIFHHKGTKGTKISYHRVQRVNRVKGVRRMR